MDKDFVFEIVVEDLMFDVLVFLQVINVIIVLEVVVVMFIEYKEKLIFEIFVVMVFFLKVLRGRFQVYIFFQCFLLLF